MSLKAISATPWTVCCFGGRVEFLGFKLSYF